MVEIVLVAQWQTIGRQSDRIALFEVYEQRMLTDNGC
jgi:hypothetical protein